MYTHRFANDPTAIAAIRTIGPRSFVSILRTNSLMAARQARPECPNTDVFVDTLLCETLSGIWDERLTLSAVSDALYPLLVTIEGLAAKPADVDEGAAFVQVLGARHLLESLDAGGSDLADQIDGGVIDWSDLYIRLQRIMRDDPGHLARKAVETLTAHVTGGGTHLFMASIERVIEKELRRDPQWLDRQDRNDLVHVIDWISGAWNECLPWVFNVNEQGVPKKLAKLGSLPAMVREADKQMGRRLTSPSGKAPERNDEQSFADDGGEFHLVRMLSPSALDRESAAMVHCIGHGGYDRALTEDGRMLLSLRDRDGRPLATMEVDEGVVVQFKGRANSEPEARCKTAAERLLAPHGITWRTQGSVAEFIARVRRRNFVPDGDG